MSADRKHIDWWRGPTFLLWLGIFAVGLFPEPTFFFLRGVAGVAPYEAIVNSPVVITLGLAFYLGHFVTRRCIEQGLSVHEAQGRGVQIVVLGLLAFLDLPYRGTADSCLVVLLLRAGEIDFPTPFVRNAVYITGGLKLFGWLYLLSLMARYYLFGNDTVFVKMPCLFPAAHPASPVHPNQSSEPDTRLPDASNSPERSE